VAAGRITQAWGGARVENHGVHDTVPMDCSQIPFDSAVGYDPV
jgi:hypothetical protein